ncbi:MAG: CotH kinase family protein [Eubacterium sp.]
MEKQHLAKATAVILTASLLLPSMTPADTQAKAKIRLSAKKLSLKVGQTKKLKVKGTKKKVLWKSSKKKIVSVSKKGIVKALNKGKAKITASVAKKKLSCMIVVKTNDSKSKTTTAPVTQAPTTQTPTSQAPATQTPTTTNVPAAATATPVTTADSLQTPLPITTSEATATVIPSATPTPVPTPAETPFMSMDPYIEGAPATPALSRKTGVYHDTFRLYMATQPGTEIYYTTDGSIPTKDSAKYNGSIEISCRNGANNVLCSEENVKKMNIAGSGYDYVPADNEVDKCTIIRAVSIAPDGTTSPVITNSFFVGNDMAKYAGATVASVVMDPKDLLDYNTGILALGAYYDEWRKTTEGKKIIQSKAYWNYEGNYTQSGKNWECPATMDYIDPTTGNVEFSIPLGVRLHGGASRMYGQKSFKFYMREDYGQKNLKYELLPNDVNQDGKQIQKYKGFILRNGGNDTELSKIRDVFIQSRVTNRSFGTQAVRPCVLFLNGEYWGLYTLTERYSDDSFEANYGVDKDNVVVFKEDELDEGIDEDQALYDELMSYANKDFTDDAVYEEFCKIVDIDSFTDYYATEIYIGNSDWLITSGHDVRKNYLVWRARTAAEDDSNPYTDGKWRYMVYDTEYAMGLYSDGKQYATTPSFTKAKQMDPLFAAVIKNNTFYEKFVATIKEIGSTNFEYNACCKKLEELTALYKPLMQDFYTRYFGLNDTWHRKQFDANVNELKDFLKVRYDNIIKDVEK